MRAHSLQVIFAALLFSLWMLGILAMQINIVYGLARGKNLRWLTFWKRWDVMHLCPNFAFFSRLPTVHFHFLIRDQLLDNEYAAWRVVALPKRSIANALCNPGRRKRFAVEDACRSLLTQVSRNLNSESGADPVCLSFMCLLHYAAVQPASPHTAARQFMIAVTQTLGSKKITPVFVSPLFVQHKESLSTAQDVAIAGHCYAA